MMMPDLVPHHIYILHSRNYLETSLLADIFSEEEGRYSLIIRGAKGKKSKYQGLIQPFSPILVTSYGQGELRTSGTLDFSHRPWRLKGENLLIGLYANELLYRLLGNFDEVPALYANYENLLAELEKDIFDIYRLREFELSLLANLGYGVSFDFDVRTGESIRPEKMYRFVAEEGFHSLSLEGQTGNSITGENLLAIVGGERSPDVSRVLKQVVRESLQPLLGAKPLKSRSLFEGRE